MQAGHSFLWVFTGIVFLIYELAQKITMGMSVAHVQSIPHETDLKSWLDKNPGIQSSKKAAVFGRLHVFPIKHWKHIIKNIWLRSHYTFL